MNNLALSEATPVGWTVYKLEGYDPEGGEITFGLVGSDNFMVEPKTGEVKVIKSLDREVTYTPQIAFYILRCSCCASADRNTKLSRRH